METTRVHQDLIGKSYSDIVSKLKIDEDHGDCCGYASCETTDNVIPEGVDTENLVLIDCVHIQYKSEYDSRSVLNFVFTDGIGDLILGYELSAGSGSGWGYGAYVTLSYEDRELASASW